MKKDESNSLLLGLILGGILSAGLAILVSSRFIINNNRIKKERRHKFFEGLDDIFDESGKPSEDDDNKIDKETEDGIIDELFSRTN
jgi:esterase/lipase